MALPEREAGPLEKHRELPQEAESPVDFCHYTLGEHGSRH